MATNETGNIYGRLIVLERNGSINNKAAWLCQCSCGNRKVVTGDSLRTGNVSSCGCYQRECRGLGNRTHGMTRTGTYRSWQEMKTRCNDPSSISYPNYGGRGITICERWTKFENFLEDMGERPEGCSLDRKNNSAGYSKRNCRWVSRTTQNGNKRNNRVVRYKGKVMCLAAWCSRLDLPYPRTYHRVVIQGWPAKKAFETGFIKHEERKRA